MGRRQNPPYIKNCYKRLFREMIFINKEQDNCLNKITDIEHLDSSYNTIFNFLF